MLFAFKGTASVIIALTDGELNEWQFATAQREVSTHTRDSTRNSSRNLMLFFFAGPQDVGRHLKNRPLGANKKKNLNKYP